MKASVVTLSVVVCCSAYAAGAAAADCTTEAAKLAKAESNLPRLEVSSRRDREIFCITLETVIAFAGRLKAHVAHCPDSDRAQSLADWDRTRADYARQFSQRRCRRHL